MTPAIQPKIEPLLTLGGHQPRWRGDGAELFYIGSDGALMAVPVNVSTQRNALDIGTETALFTPGIFALTPTLNHEYAVSRDGQRFLVHVVAEEATRVPITVVVNWAAALSQ